MSPPHVNQIEMKSPSKKPNSSSSLSKVKNVAVVYRPKKAQATSTASELVTWLKSKKLNVHCLSAQAIHGTNKIKSEADIAKIDLFIVIGGDGTYLKAARLINGRPIPILGINLGSLGFLTEVRTSDIYKTIESAISGKLKTQQRTMLEVTITKKGKKPATYLALNDVVIERGPISRLISLGIYSDDHLVSELKADGLIVCSPTGSTAYNLASGGPIVHPEVHAIMITPICPHSLTNRPITLPDHHVINIKVTQSTQKAVFMVDGQKCADIRDLDEVTIRVAKQPHLRLIAPTSNYFDVLRNKLKFGQRE